MAQGLLLEAAGSLGALFGMLAAAGSVAGGGAWRAQSAARAGRAGSGGGRDAAARGASRGQSSCDPTIWGKPALGAVLLSSAGQKPKSSMSPGLHESTTLVAQLKLGELHTARAARLEQGAIHIGPR